MPAQLRPQEWFFDQIVAPSDSRTLVRISQHAVLMLCSLAG